MGLTALGLIAAREGGGDPRGRIALMTAAFSAGQIIGPGLRRLSSTTPTGSLAGPSLLAAAAGLVVAAPLSLPVSASPPSTASASFAARRPERIGAGDAAPPDRSPRRRRTPARDAAAASTAARRPGGPSPRRRARRDRGPSASTSERAGRPSHLLAEQLGQRRHGARPPPPRPSASSWRASSPR